LWQNQRQVSKFKYVTQKNDQLVILDLYAKTIWIKEYIILKYLWCQEYLKS